MNRILNLSESIPETETRPGTSRAWSPRCATSRTWWASPSSSSSRRAGARRTTSPPWCLRPTTPLPRVEYHCRGDIVVKLRKIIIDYDIQQTRRLCWIRNCSWICFTYLRQGITLLAGMSIENWNNKWNCFVKIFLRPWRPSCATTMTQQTWRTSTSWSRGSSPPHSSVRNTKYFLPSVEMMKYFPAGGNKQGAEERSSLLNKLLFSEYAGNKKVWCEV